MQSALFSQSVISHLGLIIRKGFSRKNKSKLALMTHFLLYLLFQLMNCHLWIIGDLVSNSIEEFNEEKWIYRHTTDS